MSHNRPMSLSCIVYVSTASGPMGRSDLDELLVRGRARNILNNVSGVLLYDSGNFMHCIEGPNEGLHEVYGRITRSKLHHGVIQLLEEKILVREFGAWSMAFRMRNTFGLSAPAPMDALRQKLEARLDDQPENMSAARMIMKSFWKIMTDHGLANLADF